MTADRYARLRECLPKATMGKWECWAGTGWGPAWAEYFKIERDETIGWPVASDEAGFDDGTPNRYVCVCPKPDDQAYIAAASPATIRALLAELDAAKPLIQAACLWYAAATADIENGTKTTDEAVSDAQDNLFEEAHAYAEARHQERP